MIDIGDKVTLQRPEDPSESPGYSHVLDRFLGRLLTVRTVADARGTKGAFKLALLWELSLPVRESWLRKI